MVHKLDRLHLILYSNDLMYTVDNIYKIYNYADDNTICVYDHNIDNVIRNVQLATNVMLKWFKTNYLQAHLSKFQFILFNKEMLDKSICINDVTIKAQNSVKLLGVHIDHAMNFDTHITEICKKAGRHINVLARLSKTLEVQEKLLLFESFILSHFNYCPLVWHNCSIANMKKIEKLQIRALRFVYNDFSSSYSELRGKAGKICYMFKG